MNGVKTKRLWRPILMGLFLASILVAAIGPGPAFADQPQVAPLRQQETGGQGSNMGFVPPPGDLSHIEAPIADVPQPILSRFDWREAGKVTSVKNQGPCGSCYAFASLANFESRLLIDGAGVFDFSENNVKECEWYGSSCSGGNYWRVANFLSANGTVLETCDPYVPSNVACTGGCPYRRTLLDWRVISYDAVPSVNVLKSYVQAYGPVYTSMYAGYGDAWYSEFQTYNGSYTLYYGGSELPNHAVLIVGWDDDLAHAGGQGAWIVKNSWGTSWGGTCGYGSEGGYFTLAYGSAQIGSYSSFLYEWQNYDPNGSLLHYDEGGYTSSVGYGNTTVWGMCKFIPGADVLVERVEFWALDTTTDVDVRIYDDFNGSSVSNLLTSKLNNVFDNPGYHSVALDTPLPVASGDDFYVVVKITDASYVYPMAFDAAGPRASGRCYISPTGATYAEYTNGDIGIRARVTEDVSCGGIIQEPAIVGVADVPADNGGFVTLSWKRSIYDDEGSSPQVKRYRIWRKRREVLPAFMTLERNPQCTGPFEHGEAGPAWEAIGSVGATGICCYEFDAPTHCDSTDSDTCWTYFVVTAHTGTLGEHFDSGVDRGYSVDNMAMLRSSRPYRGREDESDDIPGKTRLDLPRPNPGDNGFTLIFELASTDWVELDVYDVTGRRVAVLREGLTGAGTHRVEWRPHSDSASSLSPGLYFVRLVTTSEVHTVKLMMIK